MGAQGSRCEAWGELTPKEMRFAEEYVKDFNGAEACRRAGIGDPKTAPQSAQRYIKKPQVQAYIQKLMIKTSEQCQTEVNDLMEFWTKIMLDPNESTANRLKASDYLGKVLGAFTIKVETQKAPTIVMDLCIPPAPEPLALEPAVEYIMDDDDTEDEYDS